MKSKLLNYALISKYPLFCFIAGIISVGVGMHQNLMKKEIVLMASVFGGLMLLTIVGIYSTRYVVVKNIVETLEEKQIQVNVIDASLISFSYQEDNYKMNLYASRGTTFVLFYKNEKLIANKAITYSKESLSKMVALLDSDKPLSSKKYKVKIKSKWL
jgi:cation transport ATPase